jgi:hypothetical protein
MTRQSRAQFIADYLTSHLLPKEKTEQRQGAAVTRARTVPPRKPGPPPPRTLQTAERPLQRPAGLSPINDEQVVKSAAGTAGIAAVASRTIYSLHISGQDADEKEDDEQNTEYLREVKNLDTSKLSDITGDGLRRSTENNPNSA